MNYTDFKAILDAKRAAAETTTGAERMSESSEARQRIEASIVEGRSKLLCNKNK